MKQRFRFSFSIIERKLLKEIKGLKKKRYYTIKEMEVLIRKMNDFRLIPIRFSLQCEIGRAHV